MNSLIKKLALTTLGIFLTGYVFAGPNNTMSVPHSFSPNTTIDSSQVNSNNNEVQTKYNSHTHNDITQTGVITSGTWQGTVIDETYGGLGGNYGTASPGTLFITTSTGTVGKIYHGTYKGDLLIGQGTSAAVWLSPGTSGYFLMSNGTSANPSWSAGEAANSITRGFEIDANTTSTCAVSAGTLFHGSTAIDKTSSTTLVFATADDWFNGTASSYTGWCNIGVSSAGAVKLLGQRHASHMDIAGNAKDPDISGGANLYYASASTGLTDYWRVLGTIYIAATNVATKSIQYGDTQWYVPTTASCPQVDASLGASAPTEFDLTNKVPPSANEMIVSISCSGVGNMFITPGFLGRATKSNHAGDYIGAANMYYNIGNVPVTAGATYDRAVYMETAAGGRTRAMIHGFKLNLR